MGAISTCAMSNSVDDGMTDCGIVLSPSGGVMRWVSPAASTGAPPGWYSGLSGSICAPNSCALAQSSLRINLQQLGPDRQALRVAAHRLLEDLLGLQITAVGEVDVGLGHRIDIADGVELAQ